MKPVEIAHLIRGVKAACPAQKWDEASPEMWLQILAHDSFADAKTAVITLARSQTFIAPGEIHGEVARMRAERLGRMRQPIPNTVAGVKEGDEIRAVEAAIADGLIATEADLTGYETWGGSLHLARQAGRFPAIEPVTRPADPQKVVDAIAGTFPLRPEMPREIADVLERRRPPGTAIRCPVCHAAPNRKCTAPGARGKRRELSQMHGSRIDAWATAIIACPDCQASPGDPCTEYGQPYRGGSHRARALAAGFEPHRIVEGT